MSQKRPLLVHLTLTSLEARQEALRIDAQAAVTGAAADARKDRFLYAVRNK